MDHVACGATEGVAYWWRGVGSDGSDMNLTSARHKADTMRLTVWNVDLVAAVSYTMTLVGYLTGNPAVRGSDSLTVYVEPQPLQVALSGSELVVGSSTPLLADASASTDPDNEPGQIAFAWTCSRPADGQDCRAPGGALLELRGNSAATLTLDLSADGASVNYTLGVIGTKGARSASASMQVTVREGQLPVLRITQAPLEPVSAAIKLTLSVDATSDSSGTLARRWRVAPLNGSPALALDNTTLACAGVEGADLVLRARAMYPGSSYAFTHIVTDAIGEAAASMHVQ
eukprot:gene26179-32076_t